MSAREAALLTLAAMERQKAWSNGHLKKVLRDEGLDRRDAALATRLCFGVLQNKLLLDFYLQHFSTMKLSKMESKVLANLRLGLYQMLFLTRIPPNAAVSEAVELTKKHCKNPRAAGMVNGILRNIARHLDELPAIHAESPEAYLSLLYSHPQWLVEAFRRRLSPQETEKLFKCSKASRKICELRNIINVGYLIMRQAKERHESRGLHYTIDYPPQKGISHEPSAEK